MKLGGGNTNSFELSLLNFLPLIKAISWPPPLIAHLFSPWLFWRLHHFLQLIAVFCLDFNYKSVIESRNSFENNEHIPWIITV